MKKRIFAAMIAALCLSTACEKQCDKHEENHDFSKTIGLAFFYPENDWRQTAINYGVARVTQMNYDYDLKISTTGAQQEAAINQMANKGIKTIVVCDQGMSAEAVNKVIAKGVNIVLFDGDIPCNYACYVSGSHEDMGKLSGEYLKNKPINKVVAFNITSALNISTPRVDAFKKAIGTGKTVKVIDVAGFTPEAGKMVLDQVVAETPDAIWVQDDQVLMGILDDLKTRLPNLKYITSGAAYQPFLQVLKNNTSSVDLSTVTYSPQGVEKAVDIAINLIKGTNPSEKRIIIPSSLVTKDNVTQFIKGGGVKF